MGFLFAAAPSTALAVEVLFDLATPQGGPFPSDVFTRRELRNLTLERVALPLPDCAARPTDCQDTAVLNELDGFNSQTHVRIPLSGPVDLATVNSDSVFLVKLADAADFDFDAGRVVGINQIEFDPATNTLFAETDELLEQHTSYALIVTNDVRDPQGARVRGLAFQRFLFFGSQDRSLDLYRAKVLLSLVAARVLPTRVAAVSVFTTQSATAMLEKIHAGLGALRPAAARFDIANGGGRAVFPRSGVASIALNRQVGTTMFATSNVSLTAIDVIPGAVGTLAFGSYLSPDFETADKFIPQVNTRTGMPQVQSVEPIYFNLVLPSGPAPEGGWPVALFGHGFGGTKSAANGLAASFASQGIATLAINVVGHGGGDQGTLTVTPTAGAPLTFPFGGRGIDQNGDGLIDGTEGVNAAPPRDILGSRDGLRQTVVDLMQLVRVIETGGMDVDGDGRSDLSRSRIYYSGISFGGIYGTMLLAVEDGIRAGVPNVPGGSITEVARLGIFRPLVAQTLGGRVPPLLNALPPTPPLLGFNENMPLRNLPPVVNNVPGAIAIQEVFENTEWATQQGNPVAYAPHIVQEPLGRNRPKRVIFQFAKGDQVVPNPTFTALARAGGLAGRSTYFRNDLFIQALIAQGVPANVVNLFKNPHTFLADPVNPVSGAIALAGQSQIALFFATDGAMVIDPDGPGPLYETPIAGALPEALNFIP